MSILRIAFVNFVQGVNMANDISAVPWFFDSVMAAPYPHEVFIESIEWTDFGAADSLVIKDNAGKTILDTKTTAGNTTNYQSFSKKCVVHGFQITALTAGGKVTVNIK